MTAAEARAMCGTLVVRPRSQDALVAAGNALADVAGSLSARVELDATGVVFLDCTGSSALCASEAELATVLVARAERQGLRACVGIGSSKLTARVGARESGGVRIISPSEERAYLARLPIALLDPDEALATTLASWGIRRIGDLLALPAGEVAHRLGPAGARLVRRAHGHDDTPLACRAVPLTFSEAIELEYGVEHIEPLLFMLHRLVDRLASRLALHGLGSETIQLRLALDGGGSEVRQVAIAAPTRESKVLLTVIRTHLEGQLPSRAVVGITVIVTPARIRPAQLDFFRPSGPSPMALAATIARLATLCGSDRIGAPACVDSHRPGAVTLTPFPGPLSASPAVACAPAAGTVVIARVALRAFRPPASLEVFESGGRLDYMRGRGLGGRVVHLAGPWHVRGEWWTVDPYAREYYDVELSDGGVYRIYRDVRTGGWSADGVYD
jgi:protein ImuB